MGQPLQTLTLRLALALSAALGMSGAMTGCASGKLGEPSEAQVNAESAKAYAEVRAKSRLSTNAVDRALVEKVANRIARASGENFAWEVMLIESPELNAWCMPGGKMAVYTGILPVLRTAGALAAVLGHEVAHATRRHGLQRYARSIRQSLLGLVVGGAAAVTGQVLCKTEQCRLLSGIGGAAGGLAITFFDRKYSRADESEADQAGQIYMARAGYDPSESIQLWERMGKAQGGAPPEWISTHPSDSTRRANLTRWMPEAQAVYQQAPERYGVGVQIR